jgi:hypothetical protein
MEQYHEQNAPVIINSINNTNHYKVQSYLGNSPQFATYLVNDTSSNMKYICKTRKSVPDVDATEVELYKYLANYKNITKYINPLVTQVTDPTNNLTHSIYNIVNGGILLHTLLQHKLRTSDSYLIIKHLLICVANIHKVGITHNNINEYNVVILNQQPSITSTHSGYGGIKLINFTKLSLNHAANTVSQRSNKTLKNNNARNIMRSNLLQLKKRDCWACAILCLRLLLGNPPYLQHQPLVEHSSANVNADDADDADDAVDEANAAAIIKTVLAEVNNIIGTAAQQQQQPNRRRITKRTLQYIKLIIHNMMEHPFDNATNPPKYTADKIVIYEKYSSRR